MLRTRFFTDIAAAGLIILSLAYFFTGGALHEWAGLAAVLLLLAHNVLNRRWWKKPLAGTLTLRKAATFALNLALASSLVSVAGSGVMLSGEIFPFVPSGGGLFARKLHTAGAFWLFVLSAAHAGTHAEFLAAALKNIFSRSGKTPRAKADASEKKKNPARFILPAAGTALAVCGIFAAARRSLPQKLFAEETFDPLALEDALPRFLFDYFCIAALFFFAALVLKSLFSARPNPGEPR